MANQALWDDSQRIICLASLVLLTLTGRVLAEAKPGDSCPPCTSESINFQNTFQVYQNKISEVKAASSAATKAQEAVEDALANLKVAKNEVLKECAPIPNPVSCTVAHANFKIREEQFNKKVEIVQAALKEVSKLNKELFEAKKAHKEAHLLYLACKHRKPGECQKCENGVIVVKTQSELGPCKKCENGVVVNDDTKDPGMCKKCENGVVVNDDTEKPGLCKKCENGAVVNDDTQNPGVCKKCSGGKAVPDNTEDPGVCNKCSGGKEVPDNTEDPGVCNKCSGGEVAPDNSEDPGVCKKCSNGEVVNDNTENPGVCKECSGGVAQITPGLLLPGCKKCSSTGTIVSALTGNQICCGGTTPCAPQCCVEGSCVLTP